MGHLSREGLAGLVAATMMLAGALSATADEGWAVTSFASDVTIQHSGALRVTEDITVDFGSERKHGIYRTLTVRSHLDDSHDRLLRVTDVAALRDGRPAAATTDATSDPARERIQIGDADRTVAGVQRYRLTYTLAGALNARHDADELYWNATGDGWPMPLRSAAVTVHAPAGALRRAICHQGPTGGHDTCPAAMRGGAATYREGVGGGDGGGGGGSW
jgi:hypothetical protein